jgi:Photosystem II Psb31 protein
MDRRSAVSQVAFTAAAAAGALAAPQLALADGAVSAATKQRATAVYGGKIAALKSAVDSGNFSAVADEKNAFILFNSGAYPTAKDKSSKAAAVAATNDIFKAVKAGDKAGLKKAYDSYVASNGIKPLPALTVDKGQGFGSDYDYRARTVAG